jgi:hypothetical protein
MVAEAGTEIEVSKAHSPRGLPAIDIYPKSEASIVA